MTASFATAAELDAWLPTGTVANDAERMLARATALVAQQLRYPYAVDAGGAATDAMVIDALRDATCAVVEAWIEAGEANDLDGLAGTQMSVPGYSGPRAVSFPPRAYRALSQAGLMQPNDQSVCW